MTDMGRFTDPDHPEYWETHQIFREEEVFILNEDSDGVLTIAGNNLNAPLAKLYAQYGLEQAGRGERVMRVVNLNPDRRLAEWRTYRVEV